jgi:hypothetical protein
MSPVFPKKSWVVAKNCAIDQMKVVREAKIRDITGIKTRYLELTKNFSKLFFMFLLYQSIEKEKTTIAVFYKL